MSRNIRVEFVKILEDRGLYIEFAENVKVYGERVNHPTLKNRETGCSTVLDVMMGCKSNPEEFVAEAFRWETDRKMWEMTDIDWREICAQN